MATVPYSPIRKRGININFLRRLAFVLGHAFHPHGFKLGDFIDALLYAGQEPQDAIALANGSDLRVPDIDSGGRVPLDRAVIIRLGAR